ncbi:PREDICTED: germin-like protein subfamily T member 2 [Fragaria vesca subsp. vesca]|uniref:germin-like protein subfamily T member 2 n=1 Tax=Fragaria vesca subsp. vesca TaxID=101020 RepID=UPI0002C2E8C4|nr:PREDICTED: germin-like protein subfamily T member 2 [Fragaria vesca subsp. vesca]
MVTSSPSYLCYFVVSVLLLSLPSHFADPDPLQDFCVADFTRASKSDNVFACKAITEVTSDDFVFDGAREKGNITDLFGLNVTDGNVLAFPALNTLGVSMNRVDFAPGALNPPHLHPRASEIGIVIEGTILAGFVTTNNVYYSKVLTAGQMFVIPRGLVHFQLNIGQGNALSITAFNSHLPGSSKLPLNMFSAMPSIPDQVLTKTFQVDQDVISSIRSKFG